MLKATSRGLSDEHRYSDRKRLAYSASKRNTNKQFLCKSSKSPAPLQIASGALHKHLRIRFRPHGPPRTTVVPFVSPRRHVSPLPHVLGESTKTLGELNKKPSAPPTTQFPSRRFFRRQRRPPPWFALLFARLGPPQTAPPSLGGGANTLTCFSFPVPP